MKIEEYVKKEDINVSQLARRVKLSHRTLYSIMQGRDCRGSVYAKLQKYTNGKISLEDYFP